MEVPVHELSVFLLTLHAAARDVPFESFQHHALTALKGVLPFDSARWGTACSDTRGAEFHAPYLYEESPEMQRDYDELREHDGPARWCLAHLDTVLNVQLAEHFAERQSAGLLDYVRRYRHIQALIIGHKEDGDGVYQAISLFGAYRDKPFTESQRRMLGVLFPHLAQALRTSLAFHAARVRPGGGVGMWTLAICDRAGYFRFVEPRFRDWLKQEWPTQAHDNMAAEIMRLATTAKATHWHGRAAMFHIEAMHDTVFVHARAAMPVDALSRRELDIARLVAAGQTHKEIARSLAIAPATVRNHLQTIHERAGVHNNAELVMQLKLASL